MSENPTSVLELYGELWAEEDAGFSKRINESLNPRRPDMLYERFGRLGVGPEARVLDLGCRDAGHAVELVKRFGCCCVAVDPIPRHVEMARKKVAEAGLDGRIMPLLGRIERLELDDGSIDHIWCRDVLNHVDLPRGFVECARVLKPGGAMFLYVTLATDLLEPKEARMIFNALAIIPENMAGDRFEARACEAGFMVEERDPIDSEWREHGLENGDTEVPQNLLRVARMRGQRDELIRRYGRKRYESSYAGDLWGVYQLLGKLCPTLYVLRKPAPDA